MYMQEFRYKVIGFHCDSLSVYCMMDVELYLQVIIVFHMCNSLLSDTPTRHIFYI